MCGRGWHWHYAPGSVIHPRAECDAQPASAFLGVKLCAGFNSERDTSPGSPPTSALGGRSSEL